MIELELEFVLDMIETLCKYAKRIGEKPDDVINEFIRQMEFMMHFATFNDYKGV